MNPPRDHHAVNQYPPAAQSSDEAEHPDNRPADPQPAASPDPAENPYRPSVPLHPAAQSYLGEVPASNDDWALASLSRVSPVEFAELLTAAGLRVWEDLGGAILLCESDGRTRAELPWGLSRPRNGAALPAAYFEDAWRRVNLGTATRTELVELLVAARLCVQANSAHDLQLVEWGGTVRAVLPASSRSPPPPVA